MLWQQQLTRPLLWGFPQALVQRGGRRASRPEGLGSQERSREEVRPIWLLICFPNKKRERQIVLPVNGALVAQRGWIEVVI